MARVFITGSSDGLGLMVGQVLTDQGHRVVLHARSDARAADAKRALPKAEAVVVGDLASLAATKDLAAQVNALGSFDADHPQRRRRLSRRATRDKRRLAACLRHQHARALCPHRADRKAKRLVYLSSGMHERANANLDDILWRKRQWDGSSAYAESKLHDTLLAFAVARLWPNVLSNAVTPGWVANQNGRRGRARRHRPGASHASVAGDQRRGRRTDHRRLFLSLAASRAEPGNQGCRLARQASRHLPGDFRGRSAAVLRRLQTAWTPSTALAHACGAGMVRAAVAVRHQFIV